MLLLLNGPPGVGKSTMAARYVADHPFALNLDIDVLRGQLGDWQSDPSRAGILARDLALAAARTHLLSGYDVVVPQFLGRVDFILALEALASAVGADFVEVILLDSKENVLLRFEHRNDPTKAVDAAELSTMYDRVLALPAVRPRAMVIPVTGVDDTYVQLLATLKSSGMD